MDQHAGFRNNILVTFSEEIWVRINFCFFPLLVTHLGFFYFQTHRLEVGKAKISMDSCQVKGYELTGNWGFYSMVFTVHESVKHFS